MFGILPPLLMIRRNIGAAAMRELLSANALCSFSANWCSALDDSHLSSLASTHEGDASQRIPPLEVLRLGGCSLITDAGISALRNAISSLRVLDLQSCAQLSNDSLNVIASCCPELLELNLHDCVQVWLIVRTQSGGDHLPQITDRGIKRVAKGCNKLQSLDLGLFADAEYFERNGVGPILMIQASFRITGRSLRRVGKHCAQLRSISLSGRRLVRSEGLLLVLRGCPALTSINLESCFEVRARHPRVVLLIVSPCRLTQSS